ncbi:MAG: hypothetical protein U5L75_03065 [Candidatus Campbellbacteria bacterium]|nr:hypothetical protein [Candidatus Campbellbacteria bacterium]
MNSFSTNLPFFSFENEDDEIMNNEKAEENAFDRMNFNEDDLEMESEEDEEDAFEEEAGDPWEYDDRDDF